jgi:serine/threonine protein kinase
MQVAHEANLCALLKHEHIVEFLGVSVIPPSIALVFELCDGGSLDTYLSKHWQHMTVGQRFVRACDI